MKMNLSQNDTQKWVQKEVGQKLQGKTNVSKIRNLNSLSMINSSLQRERDLAKRTFDLMIT